VSRLFKLANFTSNVNLASMFSVASPFARYPLHSPGAQAAQDRFPSSAFITTCQAFASCTSALIYLLVERSRKGGKGSFQSMVGWAEEAPVIANGSSNGNGVNGKAKITAVSTSWTKSLPALLLRTGLCQSMAAPIGFMSLRYISYPTMVLAKVGTTLNWWLE